MSAAYPICLGDPPVPGCQCALRLVRCPECGGRARIADHPCEHCEDGYVHACLNCASEPIDPLVEPFCSFTCRDAYAKAVQP